ncbi:MAG: UDP-N-acetylmuramate dehydrogenase [Pseudobacteriovorax sp.]|nr:UDP-N-acetylmuramate dehydrogenase [Pseudobacteriovorax sp.]
MLKDISYYKTGGTCQSLVQPKSIEELSQAVQELSKKSIPYYVLGGGTNSLVSDEFWKGAVINLNYMTNMEILDSHQVKAEGGVDNTDFAKFALKHELEGCAWMNRLPGQIGGTTRMNAKCYGGEISQIVIEVTTVGPTGEIHKYSHDRQNPIFRGYKDTIFMDRKDSDIIASVICQLKPGNYPDIESLMIHCESDRVSKGQFTYPSCGCVFKNNYAVGVPSGMLLDQAEAHDLGTKDAFLNPKHANFVFNRSAGSREIIELTLKMRDRVYQRFGVWLEYEMEILGHLPEDLKHAIGESKANNFDEEALKPLRASFQKKQSDSKT